MSGRTDAYVKKSRIKSFVTPEEAADKLPLMMSFSDYAALWEM